MLLNFVPKLEHITAIKVAIFILNRTDLRKLLENITPLEYLEYSGYKKAWEVVENKVKHEVSNLVLPERLKQKVVHFVRPIGLEILKWRDFHKLKYTLVLTVPNELCWTVHGAIDKKKTAQLLIKDGNLSIIVRFLLSCFYCFETDVMELWNQLSDESKNYCNLMGSKSAAHQKLLFFWTCHVNKKVGRPTISPFQSAFEAALECWNHPAAEYLMEKLKPDEKRESLEKFDVDLVLNHVLDDLYSEYFAGEFYTDILCFLLTNIDEEQRTSMFENCSYYILHCFLTWPWQNFFMEMADRLWGFLSENGFDDLLSKIVRKMQDGFKDYNYQALFTEFWQHSPKAFKQSVIKKSTTHTALLKAMFMIGDENNICLILNEATVEDQGKIISSCKQSSSKAEEMDCRMRFIQFLELHKEKKRSIEGECDSNLSKHKCLRMGQSE